jgi:hypothetical protein
MVNFPHYFLNLFFQWSVFHIVAVTFISNALWKYRKVTHVDWAFTGCIASNICEVNNNKQMLAKGNEMLCKT